MRSIREAILSEAHPVAVTAHYGAMARKLKVFRTPTGFHDAYVAASSRKAALKAWGADVDLFARGAAEEVDDPDLMAEALSRPGEVIRKARGTAEEHFAALPDKPKWSSKKPIKQDGSATRQKRAQPKAKPEPRPSRAKLDEAEQAVAVADDRYEVARRDLAEREAALRAERRALDAEHERERKQIENERSGEEHRYRRAVEKWRANQG